MEIQNASDSQTVEDKIEQLLNQQWQEAVKIVEDGCRQLPSYLAVLWTDKEGKNIIETMEFSGVPETPALRECMMGTVGRAYAQAGKSVRAICFRSEAWVSGPGVTGRPSQDPNKKEVLVATVATMNSMIMRTRILKREKGQLKWKGEVETMRGDLMGSPLLAAFFYGYANAAE
jgi:hypothetical protein